MLSCFFLFSTCIQNVGANYCACQGGNRRRARRPVPSSCRFVRVALSQERATRETGVLSAFLGMLLKEHFWNSTPWRVVRQPSCAPAYACTPYHAGSPAMWAPTPQNEMAAAVAQSSLKKERRPAATAAHRSEPHNIMWWVEVIPCSPTTSLRPRGMTTARCAAATMSGTTPGKMGTKGQYL
jgi:hypothetical protein